ncbi:MAG: hypothetical protein JRH15_14600 [Deltaproteobacteria bacterium]|nr:hypothetical protein [Deltaproteobacteria bacterium]
MTVPKLNKLLSIIGGKLSDNHVSHALIGAMAMALYGIPRYTADIDLISDERHRETIMKVMTQLGYNCLQDAESFAQFDSELGVYGKVDFLFVHTKEGRAILEQKVVINDDVLGTLPVVQPTDYTVLKLMAIANNPERMAHDIADMERLFKAAAAGLLFSPFESIDVERLKAYAKRFGVLEQLSPLLALLDTRGETKK